MSLARTGCRFLTGCFVALILVGCSQQQLTPLEQADANFKRGQWGLAVESSGRVLNKDPDNCQALSIRARSLAALGQYDLALPDLSRWIELAPEDPDPHYHRAIAYEKLGESELARADRNQAKAIDPLHKRAYVYDLSKPAAPVVNRQRDVPADDSEDSRDDPLMAGDSADTDDVATSVTTPSQRRAAAAQAAEDASREDAIWDRIRRRQDSESPLAESQQPAADGLTAKTPADRETTLEKPRAAVLDKIAKQLFDTEAERKEAAETEPQVAPEIPPGPPAISTALPTDPYGNLHIIPGQQPLGSNPNTGYTSPYATPYSTPYPGQPGYGYSTPPAYTPRTPGYGTQNYSNPVSSALPPQLQGRLGTNAGVTQYGGMMYPSGMGSSASATSPAVGYGTPPRGYGALPYRQGSTALPLPNYNPLTPAPPVRPLPPANYGGVPSSINPPQPISSALPPEYFQQQP